MINLTKDPWWKSLGYIVWWLLTRIWAPLMAIGWPALVIYGFLNVRPADMEAIDMKNHELAVLIGESWSGECGENAPCVTVRAQRLYIVLPRVLSNAATVEVDEAAGQLKVTDVKGDALVVLF